jgi:hypothetical protein
MRLIMGMERMAARVVVAVVFGVCLSGLVATPAWAQVAAPASGSNSPAKAAVSQPSNAAATPAPVVSDPPASQVKAPLPIDLGRISEEAQKQPAVKLDEQQLRFYVLVLAKTPKFADFIGDYDLKNGPTKGGAPMTHQEFLNMVTPKDLNLLLSSTNSSAFAMFQAAVMNAAGQALLKKAVQEIRQARDEHEVQAIRERIDRELAALLAKDQQ